MRFDKYQGLGNDFVFVNAEQEKITDFVRAARTLCDRRFGVGADGLVLLRRQEDGVQMRIFNSDGSEAEMCGNASRCVPLFAQEQGWLKGSRLTLYTLAGPVVTEIIDAQKNLVCVDMGAPRLTRAEIPMIGAPEERAVEVSLCAAGQNWTGTAVSMGNPHFVIFVPDMAQIDVAAVGPLLEKHEAFPKKTNVEFVQKLASGVLRMRVWERGAGITQACGTGSCATLVAAALSGRCGKEARILLDGGELSVRWAEDNHIFMTGPAQKVFTGEYIHAL